MRTAPPEPSTTSGSATRSWRRTRRPAGTVARKVTAEITGKGLKDLVTVTLTVDGENARITTTDGHPFWPPALGRWVKARELTVGQELRTPAGERVRTMAVNHTRRSATVHNLTIPNCTPTRSFRPLKTRTHGSRAAGP